MTKTESNNSLKILEMKNLKHYNQLDGVRAIAVIMVMFYHFFQDFNSTNESVLLLKKLSLFGKTGVSLFFVLSGFLITRILLNTKDQPSYFKNFYIRRALRIFPLYYFFLIIYYFFIPLITKNAFPHFSDQIYYWTFLQNFASTFEWQNIGPSHYWSLSVEEHFYLFWPFIIYFLPLKNIKWGIVTLFIISVITRIVLIKNNLEESQFTFARFDELAIGALLSVLEIEQKLISKNSTIFFALFLLSTIPLGYVSFKNGDYSLFDKISRHIILAIFYGSFVSLVIITKNTSIISKILSTDFLRFTGKISFGLYVYHPLCFTLILYYLHLNIIGNFLASFTFAYLISVLSYNLIEKKFLTFKRKFV